MEPKLTNFQVFRYTLFSFASGFGNLFPLSYLNVYLTNQVGINPAALASILLVPRILDFFVALIAGGLINTSKFKGGKYRPWLLIFSFVAAAGSMLQFANTSALSDTMKLVVVFCGYTMLHCSMNFIANGQYGAIMLMAGSNQIDRERLSIWSLRVGTLTAIITSATTVPLILFLSNTSLGPLYAYSIPATVYAVVFLLGILNLANLIKPYDVQSPGMIAHRISVKEMLMAVVTNSQLLVYVSCSTLTSVAMMAVGGIQAYYFIYILNDYSLMAVAMTATTCFGLVATMVGPAIGRKMGKRNAFLYTLGLYALTRIAVVFLGGKGIVYYIAIDCISMIFSAFSSGYGVIYILDCAEYGYWKSGKDNRPVATSMMNIPMKIGLFIGSSLGLYAIAMLGFDATLPVQPAAFTDYFMLVLGGIPFLAYALAFVIFFFGYKITDEDAIRYANENSQRQQAAQAD